MEEKAEFSETSGRAKFERRRENELCERYEGRRKDIKFPPEFINMVLEGINFALEQKAAQKIGAVDLHHAHMCIPWNKIDWDKPDYGGYKGETPAEIEKAMKDPDLVLLFHTREFGDRNDPNYGKRNIVYPKGEKPFIGKPKSGQVTLYPLDLKTYCVKDVYFIEIKNGKYQLKNDQKIDIFVPKWEHEA